MLSRREFSPLARGFDAIIVGGGIAGLSAAIYLGRAQRRVLVIDSGKSMARWEPKVENYLGFQSIAGEELLRQGRLQAQQYQVRFAQDEIQQAQYRANCFRLRGRKVRYHSKILLLATGILHRPPKINGVRACLGHSMFFCKDCDGARVRGQRVAIYGARDEAAEYALEMLRYSCTVAVVTDGQECGWSRLYSRHLRRFRIPVFTPPIARAIHRGCQLQSLQFANGETLPIDALFTTRGDIFYNQLGKMLGAKIVDGAIAVTADCHTTVKDLYAAGCVTPANCQMIIAAGQGAIAAQAINRQLFKKSLATQERQHREC